MVYNIAVIEDQDEDAGRLNTFFTRYGQEKNVQFQISRFQTGDSFIMRYQPIYDIVLMDIMMPGSNGLAAAQELRKIDNNVTLVFVTNMAQFAVRGYEVEAFDFVVKPVVYPNFAMKMDRVLKKIQNEQRDTFVVLNMPDSKKRIPPSQICYVEVSGHKVLYHTTEGDYMVYGSMKSAEEKLNPKLFSRCNNCYLVNLNFVSAVNNTTVTVHGEELQISRARKAAFIDRLNEFLGGNF